MNDINRDSAAVHALRAAAAAGVDAVQDGAQVAADAVSNVARAAALGTERMADGANDALQSVTTAAREQLGTAPQDPGAKIAVDGGLPAPTPTGSAPHPPAGLEHHSKDKKEGHASDDHRQAPREVPARHDTPAHHDAPAHRSPSRERQPDGPTGEDNLVSRDSTRETAENGDVIVTHHDREVRSAERVGTDGLVDHRAVVIDRTTVETTHRDGTMDRTTTEIKEVVDKDANAHGVKVDDHAMGSRVTEHVDPSGAHSSRSEQSSDNHVRASYDTAGRLVEERATQVGDGSITQPSSHPSTAPHVTTPASPSDWHATPSTPEETHAEARGAESGSGASPWGTVNDVVTDQGTTSPPAEASTAAESGSNQVMDLPPS